MKKTFENEVLIDPGTTDYMNMVSRTSTKEQRNKLFIGNVFINGAVCIHCRDFIRSKNRHDFRSCSCGKVKVDCGSHYQRLLGNTEDYIPVFEKFYE